MIDIEKIREVVHKILRRHVKASLVHGKYLDGCTQLVSREILQFLADEGMGFAEELEPLNCPEIADTPLSKAFAEVAVEQFAYYSTPRKDIKLIKFKSLKDLMDGD